jgi:hypothetical protein
MSMLTSRIHGHSWLALLRQWLNEIGMTQKDPSDGV